MDILINQINYKNIFSGWSCHATCRHVARVPVTFPPPTGVTQMLLPPHLRACRWLGQVSGLPSSDIGLVGPRYCRLSDSKIQYKYCELTLNIFALDMLDIFTAGGAVLCWHGGGAAAAHCHYCHVSGLWRLLGGATQQLCSPILISKYVDFENGEGSY